MWPHEIMNADISVVVTCNLHCVAFENREDD